MPQARAAVLPSKQSRRTKSAHQQLPSAVKTAAPDHVVAMPGWLTLPLSHSQIYDLLAGSTLAYAGREMQRPLPCCRCCSADLLSGLETLAACLLDANMALPALPVLSMHEWVARHVVQDAAATVGVRVQRVRALCQLGLPSQAVQLLNMLLKVQRTVAARVQGCANALSATGPGLLWVLAPS